MKNNKVLIVIVILIVVVLLIAGGFYLVRDYNLKQEISFLNQVKQSGDLNLTISSTDYDRAISESKIYQENYPDDVYGYLVEATAYLQQGSRQYKEVFFADKAIEVLNKALLIDPDNSEVYRSLGYAYEIKEDYVQSEASYNKSIELDPNSSLAYSGRGHMYYLYGDEKSAYEDIQISLGLNPYNAKALLDLSLYHLRHDSENVDVLEILDSAIKHTQEYEILAEAYSTRGNVLYRFKDLQNAEESYNKALMYQPQSTSALVGLSYLYFDFMELAESEEEVLEYMNKIDTNLTMLEFLNPDLTNIYIIKAIYYAFTDDYDRVSENLNQALNVVDRDITLSKTQKVEMRLQIQIMLSNI